MERMVASLEDASRICGGSLGKTIRGVLIPLSMPAILSASILVLTRAMEEFAIPGVLGAPSGIYTVTTYIYYQRGFNSPVHRNLRASEGVKNLLR
jgi:iron(III) transport system permease protein